MSAFRYKASYDNPAYVNDGLGSKKGGAKRIKADGEGGKCCGCKAGSCCICWSCILMFLVYGLIIGGVIFYYYWWIPNQVPQAPVVTQTKTISGSVKIVGGPYSTYSADLTDKNSDLYRVYSEGFSTVMDDYLEPYDHDILKEYATTKADKFTPGSVVVAFTMMFNEMVTVREDTTEWLKIFIIRHLEDKSYLSPTIQIDPESLDLEDFGPAPSTEPVGPDTTMEPYVCHDIPTSLKVSPIDCSKYWDSVYFPNLLGESSESKIAAELSELSTIMGLNCDPNLELYICSLFLPKCVGNSTSQTAALKPCKNICTDIHSNCKFAFELLSKESILNDVACNTLKDYDAQDEGACLGGKESAETTTSAKCQDGESECDTGRCVSKGWFCDGHQDCQDNADESVCGSCPNGQTRCGSSSRCIATSKLCDGVDDCYGASDEMHCFSTDANKKLHVGQTGSPKVVCKSSWDTDATTKVCDDMGYEATGSSFATAKDASTASVSLTTYDKTKNLLAQLTNSARCPSDDVVSITCGKVQCGIRPKYVEPLSRILGGNEAKPGHWPFTVALLGGAKKAYFCSGSLINDQWVLTAAHCLGGIKTFSEITLRLGNQRRLAFSKYTQDKTTNFWKQHPDYVFGTFPYDIALIKLNSPVEINDYVRPICLPAKDMPITPGMSGVAASWGKTEEKATDYAQALRQVRLGIVSNTVCTEKMGAEAPVVIPWITKDILCAGGQKGIDTCQGDSGGPLMFEHDGKWVVGGLVVAGIRCGTDIPAVYTRVPHFVDWIEDVISKN